jgi:hypothetical protein
LLFADRFAGEHIRQSSQVTMIIFVTYLDGTHSSQSLRNAGFHETLDGGFPDSYFDLFDVQNFSQTYNSISYKVKTSFGSM